MKEIFKDIPTVDAVRRWLDKETQATMEDFAKKISRAMKNLSRRSFTMQSTPEFNRLFHWIHKQKLIDALSEKGWNIKHTSDQRDGDYFQISMQWSGWQPMQD